MNYLRRLLVAIITCTLVASIISPGVLAQVQNPQSGSVGLEGTISAPPPSRGATITTPSNGQTFSSIPVTVAGLCPDVVTVKIFKNGIFAGSTQCRNGSYSLQIDLFSGKNDLVAKVTDALDQDGPDSNTVTVTYVDARFGTTGSRISLTSVFTKRGADPGKTFTWPIIISGGTGPYAISVDWGDNKPNSLLSQQFAGTFDITHIYENPGTYNITVKATDKNGDTAYLQLVGIATGAVNKKAGSDNAIAEVCKNLLTQIPLWAIIIIMIVLGCGSFWLGGRYALLRLRKKLENGGSL